MRRLIVVCLAFVGLVGSGIWADEGRIPIFQPTTITQPGHYVLTRDISNGAGDGILIRASTVTLDLNGHTISALRYVVNIGDPSTNCKIHNGRLIGHTGIIVFSTLLLHLQVEAVEIVPNRGGGGGIVSSAGGDLEVRSCRILSLPLNMSDAIVAGGSGSKFINNTILGGCNGLVLSDLVGGEVRGNIVSDFGSNCAGSSKGISITGGGGNRIDDNVVSNGNSGIIIGSTGNLIAGNVVKNILGIGPDSGFGIRVSGERNLVERNQVEGNIACGIEFVGGFTSNAYRNNMLRGNTGGAVCGPANTDAGGNIL